VVMARSRMTTHVVSRILGWRDQGLSVSEIADRIGFTPGTLRVRCSKLDVSLRRGGKLRRSPTLVCSAKNGLARTKVSKQSLVLSRARTTIHHNSRVNRATSTTTRANVALI